MQQISQQKYRKWIRKSYTELGMSIDYRIESLNKTTFPQNSICHRVSNVFSSPSTLMLISEYLTKLLSTTLKKNDFFFQIWRPCMVSVDEITQTPEYVYREIVGYI